MLVTFAEIAIASSLILWLMSPILIELDTKQLEFIYPNDGFVRLPICLFSRRIESIESSSPTIQLIECTRKNLHSQLQ